MLFDTASAVERATPWRGPVAPVTRKSRPVRKGEAPLVILGAGVAGLAAAYAFTQESDRRVLIVERGDSLGGLAGSASFAGVDVDLGSHRIHPQSLPHVVHLLRELLGPDLLTRPRRGRLHLGGSTMSYPPNIVEFASALGARSLGSCGASLLAQRVRDRVHPQDLSSFEGYLTHKVGRHLFSLFYAPYARKVYGVEPGRLAVRAAKTRVSTGRPAEMAKWALRHALGTPADASAHYLYPRDGFGSIAEALRTRLDPNRVELLLNTEAVGIDVDAGTVCLRANGRRRTVRGSAVVSSLPLGRLARIANDTPDSVLEASKALRWRAVRIILLHVDAPQCLDGDTHYLPETRFVFGRVSEPHRFSPLQTPGKNQSILRVEVICSVGDELWSMPQDELVSLVERQLGEAGIRVPRVIQADGWRLPAVYPVYTSEAERAMETVSAWLATHPRIVSIGRGGMFMHANVDHSIHVGLEAGKALARRQVLHASSASLASYTVRD